MSVEAVEAGAEATWVALVSKRIRRSVTEAEGRRSLYFNAEGRPIRPQYARDDGRGGRRPASDPRFAPYTIHHPFRPSLASVSDMVREFERSATPVVYDEERWEADPRIPEQAGASITEDWSLDELMARMASDRVAA